MSKKSNYQKILEVREWKINVQIENFFLDSILKIQDSQIPTNVIFHNLDISDGRLVSFQAFSLFWILIFWLIKFNIQFYINFFLLS
jgi:hypothetical protein